MTRMHFTKTGSGPVLVLLHGFPDSSAIWHAIAPALARRFTLILPDLPGAGDTPLEGEPTLADMATGVRDILRQEAVDKAVVMGHSMGGYTACAFARLYPELLAGLTLIHSTPVADDDEKKKTRLKAIELIRNGGRETFIRQMTANLFAPAFREANPQVVADKTATGMRMGQEALINFYRAMIGRDDNTDVLAAAQFPVQWVLGQEDAIIPYQKNLQLAHASGINFVTLYKGCGHMSMIENPAQLIADLQRFGIYCYDQHLTAK